MVHDDILSAESIRHYFEKMRTIYYLPGQAIK